MIAAVAVTAIAAACSSPTAGLKSSLPESSPSNRPDIGELSRKMLVPCTEFPQMDSDCYANNVSHSSPAPNRMGAQPAECAVLFGSINSAAQQVSAYASSKNGATISVALTLGKERPNLRSTASKCPSGNLNGAALGFTTRKMNAPGIPNWALGFEIEADDHSSDTNAVMGYARGVFVHASYYEPHASNVDPQKVDRVVAMFNEQATRLGTF
jgi:hypothetical protein